MYSSRPAQGKELTVACELFPLCRSCLWIVLQVLRGSGSDIQIVGAAMKKYATSKEKDIHKLMQYADQLRVKPKVLRYMEVLL